MNTEISAESVRAKEAEALLNTEISAESIRAKEAEATIVNSIKKTYSGYDKETLTNILKTIYSDIWTNTRMTNYDQGDSNGTSSKITLYISRDYTLIINASTRFFSYFTRDNNSPHPISDFFLDMELNSSHSRQNYFKVISTEDSSFLEIR